MSTLRKLLFGTLTLAMLILAGTAPALARALESERQAGLVGDQADGYMGIVRGGSGALAAQVERINAQRRAYYADVAAKRGTTVEAVGAIFAQDLYNETQSGEYFRDANGNWIKKP